MFDIIYENSKYFKLDYDYKNNKIVLFSNGLLSFICYYNITKNDTLNIIDNNILFINMFILSYYSIFQNNNIILFSFFMPIQYIIENRNIKNILLNNNLYDYFNINIDFYVNKFILVNEKKIIKNHDLLFDIIEYKNNKWIPIFYNDFRFELVDLFNSDYIKLFFDNLSDNNIDGEYLFFYREKNILNGNYVLTYTDKPHTHKRFFCNFNNLKIYKNNEWIAVPENVLLPFADFVQSEQKELHNENFTLKYNENKSIIYTVKNTEYLISNNYKVQLLNSLVNKYYNSSVKALDIPEFDDYLQIFNKNILYQLLDIRNNNIKIKINSIKNKVNLIKNKSLFLYSDFILLKKNNTYKDIKNSYNLHPQIIDILNLSINEILSNASDNITVSICLSGKKEFYIEYDLITYLNFTKDVQECVNILFTNIFLTAFFNNLLFGELKFYIDYEDLIDTAETIIEKKENDIIIVKNAIIHACSKLDELGFKLEIILLFKEENNLNEFYNYDTSLFVKA